MHLRRDLAEKSPSQLGTTGSDASHYFGRVSHRKLPVPRVDPLGRESQVEIFSRLEARSFQDGEDLLLRRPGVGRALQDHQLAQVHPRLDALCSRHDVG